MESVRKSALSTATPNGYSQYSWRRVVYIFLVFATSCAGTLTMTDIVLANGVSAASIGILLLFAVIFTQVSTFFWTAVLGFLIHLLSRNPVHFASPLNYRNDNRLALKTAILMPIYNEEPGRVMKGFEATIRSLLATQDKDNFQFHVLSDSTDEAIAKQELILFNDLKRRLKCNAKNIHYRRRSENINRKVGNIEAFCDDRGSQFDAMIVLDADSIMSGRAITKLARLMQNNPLTGIIQLVTLPVNQSTLFARMMQFSGRLCSEMFCTGRSFWQLGEGNYFGHNAIIRLKPFMEHCKLPVLPGSRPLSGAILSHDFAEAAWMRRAGYQVWNIADGDGSFEELPSNILDYARRDRRWCQGNLQHLRLLLTKGIHPISRMHFFMGALSFIAAPLWLVMLSLGLGQIVSQAISHTIIITPNSPLENYLLPTWPVFKTTEAMILFAITAVMLILPRLLAMFLSLIKQKRRIQFGGGLAIVCGTVVEILFAALVAPVLMVFHTCYVVLTLCGWGTIWNAQERGQRTLGIIETSKNLAVHLLVGCLLFAVTVIFVPAHLIWLSPVLAGLLFCIPLTVTSSYSFNGQWQKRLKILSTPEELFSPEEIKFTQEPQTI